MIDVDVLSEVAILLQSLFGSAPKGESSVPAPLPFPGIGPSVI